MPETGPQFNNPELRPDHLHTHEPEGAEFGVVKEVSPPAALEKVVEQKKPDFLRKLEIQLQIMKHLGYGLEEGEDPETLKRNQATMDLWRLGRLAETFDTYWKGPWVQEKLAQGASDDEIAEFLDVELNNLVPSGEIKNYQADLWPRVEKQLKDQLGVDDNDVKVFTPLQYKWEELFNHYLKIFLDDPRRKEYSSIRMANVLADMIVEATRK